MKNIKPLGQVFLPYLSRAFRNQYCVNPGEYLEAEIPQETESQVIQHIKEARTQLPFLVDLPIDERIRMAKLSRKFVDFVDRALSSEPRAPLPSPGGWKLTLFAP
jgi:hypothetical protein